MLSVKTNKKPGCCVLDKVEARNGLLPNARKDKVIIIKVSKYECVYDFFEVLL